MAARFLTLSLLFFAASTKADYGGPVGLVSQAASSSGSGYNNGGGYKTARYVAPQPAPYVEQPAPYVAQAARSSSSNAASADASAVGDQTDTQSDAYTSDDSSDYSGGGSGAASSASSSSSSGSRGPVYVPAGAGPGRVIAVSLPVSGPYDNNVRVMNLNTNAMGDMGSQIQFTIREILRKFGIQMAGNIRASFQPGQTYVFQNNGYPYNGNFDQSQFQSMGSGAMAQSQSGGGMSQYQSNQQPVAVAYKYIGQPSAAVAFRVSDYGGNQYGSGAGAVSGASAQSVSVPVNNGRAVVSYSGNIRPQVTVYRNNNNDDGNDNSAAYSDASADSSSYGSPPQPAYVSPPQPAYVSPPQPAYVSPPQPARRQSVKYASSNNKKTVESSNVAYESNSEN